VHVLCTGLPRVLAEEPRGDGVDGWEWGTAAEWISRIGSFAPAIVALTARSERDSTRSVA